MEGLVGGQPSAEVLQEGWRMELPPRPDKEVKWKVMPTDHASGQVLYAQCSLAFLEFCRVASIVHGKLAVL